MFKEKTMSTSVTQTLRFSLALLLTAALWSAWTSSPAYAQDPIYVDQNATGNDDGSTWDDAYTDLQNALATATGGDEIWVATGVYTPGLTRSDTFTLTSGIALYGGFAGTESQLTERDWAANVTVLSGDIDGNDTTDADGIVTDTANLSGSNSYHVVWADGVTAPITASTVLDGFTITAGQADDSSDPDDSGGGFYCDGDGSGSECSPTLSNVTFSGNLADYDGGGMFNFGANDGSSSPTLSNVTFSGNSAGYDGGGMCNVGWYGTSSPSLSNVTFSDNSADNDGAAMINIGDTDGISSPSLVNVTFWGNVADDDGGAMYNVGYDSGVSNPSLENVLFVGNTANDSGGAMYNYGDTDGFTMPSLSNVLFSGNVAADKGGAVSNYGYDNGISQPSLANVTISRNTANFGGAIASYTDADGVSSPHLNNVILWGNSASIGTQLYNIGATFSISYSLIQSDTNAIANDATGSVIYGPNILTDDPLFVDDDGADDTVGTLDDDLRLSDGSPAIDAGNNDAIALTTDLDGKARFYDDTNVTDTGNGVPPLVDMGAYEKQTNSPLVLYFPVVVKDD